MIATLLERTESTQYRSLENPSTPLSNADEWLYDAFGSTKSQTGLRIGRKEAMSVGAFFKGVNTISRDVAKIPIPVYVRLQPQGKEVVRTHAGHQLLNKRASRRVNAFNFKILDDTVRASGNRFIRCETSDGIVVNISGARTDEQMGNGDASAHWGLEHFGIEVDDLDAEIKRLGDLGAKLLDGPTDSPTGMRIAFIQGPDDVRIELLQLPKQEA